MSKWKWFTDEETQGMTDDVCSKLDRTRDFFGYSINLTCGYRSPADNAAIGGVPDSAHCKGMAADVQAPVDPIMREKMMWAFGAAGFKRVESAPRHMHVDTDDLTKPSPCFWEGDDH
jgi:zinc D-Ala-D-Ala carboxypeptidase